MIRFFFPFKENVSNDATTTTAADVVEMGRAIMSSVTTFCKPLRTGQFTLHYLQE